MKKLSPLQRLLLLAGAFMMVAGAIVYIAVDHVRPLFSVIFLLGACLYTTMQCQQTYEGNSIVIRRLNRQLLISDALFILAGLLMIENTFNFLLPSFIKYLQHGLNSYLIFIMNKWIIPLMIGALLQMYCVIRISNELEKEAKKL
ncbi:MAG: hypothetical protein J6Z18_00925 [Prevotella sp.]|nr:hypothetical protein [Prevotella sp.]